MSTTSPFCGRGPAAASGPRGAERARQRGRSPASRTRRAALAAERAVSGRRAPGIATTAGERSSSHASATSAGVARPAAATSLSTGSRASRDARRGPPSGEWGDHGQTPLRAPFHDLAAERAIVEGAERDLDGRNGGELERLVQLRAVDVRDADPPDEALVREPSEGAHGRPPRRPRVGRVDEVEVDREAVERAEAGLAVRVERLRPAVRDPGAAGPGHASLRHDPRASLGAAAAERAREEPLVVAVRPGRVEDGHAGPGGGRDRLERELGALLRRQPHAAEADARLRGVELVSAQPLTTPRPAGRSEQVERHGPTPAGAKELDEQRRRDQIDPRARSRPPLPVPGGRPAQQLAAEHEPRLAFLEHEGAVGEIGELRAVQPATARRVQALRVETLVDRVGAQAEAGDDAVVVLAPAERAGAVPRSERRRLVEEEELREAARLEQVRGASP